MVPSEASTGRIGVDWFIAPFGRADMTDNRPLLRQRVWIRGRRPGGVRQNGGRSKPCKQGCGRQHKCLSICGAGFDDVVFKGTVRVHTAMEMQIMNIDCHIAYHTR